MQIQYGNFTVETDNLPATSLAALLRRGVSHVLGNEQSAKVGPNSSWYKNFLAEQKANPTEDQIEAQKQTFMATALEAINSGTIGTSLRGPSVPPLEAEINKITRTTVINRLKAAGFKPPKGEDFVEFSNGTKKTMAQMMATVLEKDRVAIEKEANKAIADAKRKVEQAKKAAAEAGSKNAEDLGL